MGRGEITPAALRNQLSNVPQNQPLAGLPGLPRLPQISQPVPPTEPQITDSNHPNHDFDLEPESEINYLNGSESQDTINGGQGRDLIDGGMGNDILFGLDGNDTLYGNQGFDRLNGGAGDDVLDGGMGISVLKGGTGSDTFVLYDADMTWIQDFKLESDRLELENDLTYESLEIDGEVNSFISYEGKQIAALLDVNPEQLSAALFIDQSEKDIQPSSEINYLNASEGQEVLNGSQGRDVINGDINNNILFGMDGNDTLFGNEGFDRLNGGAGDDMLDGGTDTSVLNGGTGNDTFVLHSADLSWIQDFELERDTLGLSDGMTYESLDINGSVNTFITHQGNQVATLLGVNPDELNSDRFIEV